MKMLYEQMKQIANKAYEVLQKYHRDIKADAMPLFPKGACMPASILLGTYLLEQGFKNVNIAIGQESDSTQTHVWIIWNNDIVIDLTYNQFFPDFDGPYIGAPTAFHKNYSDNFSSSKAECYYYDEGEKAHSKFKELMDRAV